MQRSISASILMTAGIAGAAHADPDPGIATVAQIAPAKLPHVTGSIGIGTGYLGGDDASQGMAWRLGLGYHLTPRAQVALNGDFVSFARYRPDPSLSRQVGVMTLGLRWRPFGERPADDSGTLDRTNIQLHAGFGVAHAIRVPYADLSPFAVQQGDWGPAAVAAIAWLPIRGAGWQAGIELQATYAYFGSDSRQASTAGTLVFAFDLESTSNPRPAPSHNGDISSR